MFSLFHGSNILCELTHCMSEVTFHSKHFPCPTAVSMHRDLPPCAACPQKQFVVVVVVSYLTVLSRRSKYIP